MPHYPDDIEYSDKYTDDHYEYRHVILPKEISKKMPRSRLLTESVIDFLSRNGGLWEYSSLEDGFTMNCIAQNHTFYFSEELKGRIHRLDFHQSDLWRHPTHFASEIVLILIKS
jgi:hypothetical protein